MPSPIFLGSIGSVQDDTGPTSLSLVVSGAIPPDPTPLNPSSRVAILLIGSSPSFVGGNSSTVIPWASPGPNGSVTDDQTDPGGSGQPHNIYFTCQDNPGLAPSHLYETGIGSCNITPDMEIKGTHGISGTFVLGVSIVELIPYWGLDIGTTITIDLPTGVGSYPYLAAIGYGFQNVVASGVNPNFAARVLDPTDSEPCSGAHTPAMSTLTFDLGSDQQYVMVVGCNTSLGPISDSSGNWSTLDSGTSASQNYTWMSFLADGASIVTSSQYVTFNPTASVDTGGARSFAVQFSTPIFGNYPVFENHFRAGGMGTDGSSIDA